MKTKTLFSLLFVFFIFYISTQKISLFDGKNLDSWYAFEPTYGVYSNANDLFKLEKHSIRMYGDKRGYLMSKQIFSNFKLTAYFRWNTDSTFAKISNSKNSGLMYLVPDTAHNALWPAGIQFQIKQNSTGDFIFLGEITAEIAGKKTEAGKSVVYQKILDSEKKYGKWNKIEIIVKDGVITQKLNNKIVNKAVNPSVKSGHILLQYEGYPIDFKNVTIEKL